uniref:RdRp n=1 Tax=Wenling partiti-like virus 7 TaxID=1923525 RepID=A0A1L3KLZ9_9VIRU|nr:RdRp [Wenling partiti-like virus 7]
MVLPPALRGHYAHVKSLRFRRSRPNKQSFQKWIDKFIGRQRKADQLLDKGKWDFDLFESCLDTVVTQLLEEKTTPIPLIPDAISSLTDYSKSPGVDLVGIRRYPTKGDVPTQVVIDAHKYMAKGEVHKVPDFTVAFRSHLVREDEEDKARIVLVAPAEFVFVEKMFAEPLYNAITRIPLNQRKIATGFKWFSKHAAFISSHFGDSATSLDYSGFDLSPPHWMIRQVFMKLKECFDLNDEEDRIFDSINQVHQRHWVKYHQQRFRMVGGVKTGTAFTHILGSIIGASMILYLTDGKADALSYGDDVIMKGNWNIRRLARRAADTSSFVIHNHKSSHRLDWLGNRWDAANHKWVLIDPVRRMGQLFYPESTTHVALEVQVQAHLYASARDPITEDLALALKQMSSRYTRSEIRDVKFMLKELDLTHADPITASERLKIWM